MARKNTLKWLSLIILLIPATSQDNPQGMELSKFQPLVRNIFTDPSSEIQMVNNATIINNKTNNGDTGQTSILFGGRYTTSSDVQDIFQLGNDLAAMMDTRYANIIERKTIYQQGTTTQNTTDDYRGTLASLSLDATNLMLDDPIFTLYRHAFVTKGLASGNEPDGYYKGQDSQFYADAILLDLFERKANGGVQTEATLVLSVWMATVHELNNVLQGCNSIFNASFSLIALDRAAAFWAGADQSAVARATGIPSLYQLAQSTGEKFGQPSLTIENEAWVNSQIINTFTSLQSQLMSGELVCSQEVEEAMEFRETIFRLKELMVVPLIQNLIHYSLSGTSVILAEVYRFAVLPHILACDPNLASAIDITKFDSTVQNQNVSWVKSIQKAFSCVRLECDDIGSYSLNLDYPTCQDNSSSLLLAGYEASVPDAKSYSRMDRDLLRLEILLSFGANQSVIDLYHHGYLAPFSLQKLAVNEIIPRTAGSLFDLYNLFYGTESYTFVDEEVRRALRRVEEFEDSTTEEIVDSVVGLLVYEAAFLSVIAAMENAEALCDETLSDGLNMTASGYWDISAALYTGSIEGRTAGGRSDGRLLYAASKRLCPLFDTCFKGNSRINNVIMEAFSLGKTFISHRTCTSLVNLVEDVMIPALQEILLQGTVAFGAISAFANSSLTDVRRGTGHAFARAVLPQIHEADNESGRVIESTLLLPNSRSLGEYEFYEAMMALQAALPNMSTDCQGVGSLQTTTLNLCDSVEQQRPQNDIAFGRYFFSDTVRADQIASIALDIRDMKNVSIPDALKIYEEGRNSFLASSFRRNDLVTLASFSRSASTFMSEDPLFNIYKFMLYEDEVFDTDATFSFADDYVQKMFATSQGTKLAADSAVVLNLWMMIAHELYGAVRACDSKGNAAIYVDSAVALWIGKEQIEGSFSEGWLFYSIAQAAAEGFGQEEKEATVNTQLMDAFNSLKSTSKSCKNDLGAHLKLRSEVQSVLRLLSLPLVQQLFLAIAVNDHNKAELYSLSVIPQGVRCLPRANSQSTQSLIDELSVGEISRELLENLGGFLKCMEMSCQDFNYTETAPEALKELVTKLCDVLSEEDPVPSMFSDPLFLSASRLDLDILQIEIFMRTKAYDAAFDWYQNGRNALLESEGTYLTFQQLATLQSEKAVEYLKIFGEYHGSQTYADQNVMDAIRQQGLYRNASRIQRATQVSTALQATILYQGIIWNLQQAVRSCKDEDPTSAGQLWTTAIAIFTGSTRNHSNSDHGTGFAFSAIGEKLCQDFGSCNEDGHSLSNQAVYEALSNGYIFMGKMMCTEGEELIQSTIIPQLQVPLIQGSLKSSIFHNDKASKSKFKEEFSSGYVMAQTMLPFVANVSAESAETIASIFASPLDWITSGEETESIFEAFQNAVPEMGIDCHWIGVSVDEPSLFICPSVSSQEISSSSSGLSPAAIWILLTFLVIGMVATAALLNWRRKYRLRKPRSQRVEGNPSTLSDLDSTSSEFVTTTADNDNEETPPIRSSEHYGFDKDAIDNSYHMSSPRSLSCKAHNMLSRIVRYGDDETNIIPNDAASSDRQSSLPDVVPKGQTAIVKKVVFLVDDDGCIIESRHTII